MASLTERRVRLNKTRQILIHLLQNPLSAQLLSELIGWPGGGWGGGGGGGGGIPSIGLRHPSFKVPENDARSVRMKVSVLLRNHRRTDCCGLLKC